MHETDKAIMFCFQKRTINRRLWQKQADAERDFYGFGRITDGSLTEYLAFSLANALVTRPACIFLPGGSLKNLGQWKCHHTCIYSNTCTLLSLYRMSQVHGMVRKRINDVKTKQKQYSCTDTLFCQQLVSCMHI